MFKKMLSLLLSVLLMSIGFIPLQISFAQEKEIYTLAVLNLDPKGIPETEAEYLSESMRAQVTRVVASEEFKKTTNVLYKIIERSQMEKILDQFEFQSTGCTDVECAIEIGKMFNAERIIIGSIGLVGNTYSITARMVDVATAETVGFADYQHRGERDVLLTTGISEVVNELLFGTKKKKSKKLYYVVGGAVIAAGALAAVLGSGGGDGGSTSTGTISVSIPAPGE